MWRGFSDKSPTKLRRFFAYSIEIVGVPTFTVIKYPAGWKINSYKLKETCQWEVLDKRLTRGKFYVTKQLIKFWISRRKGNVKFNPQSQAHQQDNYKNYRDSIKITVKFEDYPR